MFIFVKKFRNLNRVAFIGLSQQKRNLGNFLNATNFYLEILKIFREKILN